MAENKADPGTPTDYEPNFEMPNPDAIHEDNWAEYEARGFIPEPSQTETEQIEDMEQQLFSSRNIWGLRNVYTGDAWDAKAGRPLRHKPGRSIYIDIEGHYAEKDARQSEGGPAAS